MLGLFLAAPFVLLVLIGLFASMKRAVRLARRRERFREQIAERRRTAEGLH